MCQTMCACNHESGLHQGWLGTPVPQINRAEKNEIKPIKNHGVYFLFIFIFSFIFGMNAGRKYRITNQLSARFVRASKTELPKIC